MNFLQAQPRKDKRTSVSASPLLPTKSMHNKGETQSWLGEFTGCAIWKMCGFVGRLTDLRIDFSDNHMLLFHVRQENC